MIDYTFRNFSLYSHIKYKTLTMYQYKGRGKEIMWCLGYDNGNGTHYCYYIIVAECSLCDLSSRLQNVYF